MKDSLQSNYAKSIVMDAIQKEKSISPLRQFKRNDKSGSKQTSHERINTEISVKNILMSRFNAIEEEDVPPKSSNRSAEKEGGESYDRRE